MGLMSRVVADVCRICAVITRVTLSAWLTWEPCVHQRGAVPSLRMMGYTPPSLWHMRLVNTHTHEHLCALSHKLMTSLPVCRASAGSVTWWLQVLRGAIRLHRRQAANVVHPDLHRRIQTLEPLHVRHHHRLLRWWQWWETIVFEHCSSNWLNYYLVMIIRLISIW